MKRILFFSAAFLLSATMMFAQGQARSDRGERNPEERITKMVDKMTENLELSEDQAASLEKQWLENHQAREAELEKTGIREERKAIVQKYREQNKAVLEAVLTAEQLEKHEAMKAERKEKMKSRRKGKRG